MRIRQSASRQGLDLRETFPLGPGHGPHRQAQNIKPFGWNAIPIEVQAANSVCSLFRQSFPTKNISPLFMSGMLRVALAYLDACVFLGLDTPAHREKLNMLLHVITAHGKIWPISLKIAEEVREVAEDYSLIPQPMEQESVAGSWTPGSAQFPIPSDTTLPINFDFSVFPALNDLNDWSENPSEDSA